MPIFSEEYGTKNTPVDDDKALIADSENLHAIKGTKISAIVSKAVSAAIAPAVNAVKALTDWITTDMLKNESVTYAKVKPDTFPFTIVQIGRADVPSGAALTIPIPTQANTNYAVLLGRTNVGATTRVYPVIDKTTTSIILNAVPYSGQTVTGLTVDYMVVKAN